ncbi:MAG: hypothetical protein WAT51_15750, partial [Holophaga sp.]
AQDVRINGGLQVGLALPTGDFATKESSSGLIMGANDGLGLHFGGHLDFNFNRHHQLRLHGDAHGFASKEQKIYLPGNYYSDTYQNAFGIAQFGGDYVFNMESPSKGFYFLAGLSLNRVTKTVKDSRFGDEDFTQSGCMGVRIGAGYTINRIVSLEGQINSVSVDAKGVDGFGLDSLTWVSFTAVFRFGRP